MKRSVQLFSIVILTMSLYACQGSGDDQQPVAIRVKTVEATYCEESAKNEFPFISKPYRSSELSFRVGGPVSVMDLHSGDYYRQGELVAAIDSRDYQIRLDRSKALYEQSEAEYKRISSLYKLNNISAAAYDQAKADYHSALAAYTSARNDLADTRLIAPFDGYIQEVLFEQYQEIRPSQALCSLIDVSRLKIEVFVPQQVAMSIKKGDEATVRFDGMPDESYTAIIEQISKGAARNNLSFVVTAILPNNHHTLPSGMSGTLRVASMGVSPQRLAIAQRVVRHTPTRGTYVWGVKNGQALIVPIITGKLMAGGMIEVSSGLTQGEEIIATSLELLTEGTPIEQMND